jgi:hypothetical protein
LPEPVMVAETSRADSSPKRIEPLPLMFRSNSSVVMADPVAYHLEPIS